MRNNEFQRLTFNLPVGQFASETEEELTLTLVDNLKREAWYFVKQTFDISVYRTDTSIFFTIPTGMSVESLIKQLSLFFSHRWSVCLPDITFTVDPVDRQGYLI